MLLVQLIGLLCNRLQSSLFEGFRASLGCFHLLRCCRSEVNIYNLVFVLIFLTGEELHEARVGVPRISWSGPAWTLARECLLDIWNVSSTWRSHHILRINLAALERAVQVCERRRHWRRPWEQANTARGGGQAWSIHSCWLSHTPESIEWLDQIIIRLQELKSLLVLDLICPGLATFAQFLEPSCIIRGHFHSLKFEELQECCPLNRPFFGYNVE